jgi:serine phosphatase RsbU (regulator of sigma subunit)
MAQLRVAVGPHAGKLYDLNRPVTVMGRHPNCDIVVDASSVSRYHAQVLARDNGFYVEDLKSRNGTFVNEQRIENQRQLVDLDHVRICDLVFVFHDQTPPDSTLATEVARPGVAAVLIDDDPEKTKSSIMSKLDISADGKHMHISVSADVKLQAFLELANSLGRSLSLDDVLPPVLESLFKIFLQADRGFIVFRRQDGLLEPRCTRFRRGQDEMIRISRTIINRVMDDRQAILSADATGDSRFALTESIAQFQIRSFMCAPLIDSEGRVLGAVQIDTLDPQREFRDKDLEILAGVASQAAMAIRMAQLHEAALERQAVQRDLELARQVQMRLLPQRQPEVPGYEFFDYYRAANQIGGDYFDYVRLPDGRTAVIVADVSGHGIAAALSMTKLAAEARFCLATIARPGDVLQHLNRLLCDDGVEDRFVTMVLVVLQPTTHELTIVNAGHLPPLCRRARGQIEPLAADLGGVPLGIDKDACYPQAVQTLQPGEMVALSTDGITEAMNEAGEQYGAERLDCHLREPCPDLLSFGNHLIDSVREFVGDRPQSDDICLVCLRRTS